MLLDIMSFKLIVWCPEPSLPAFCLTFPHITLEPPLKGAPFPSIRLARITQASVRCFLQSTHE